VSYIYRGQQIFHSHGSPVVTRPRRTLFVDRELQGTLLWRVLLYWQFFVISTSLLLLAREYYVAPFDGIADALRMTYLRYSPVLFASLIVLPIVMLDVLRITNRVAGPMLRLRRGLREVADGRPAQPINFRKEDFWRDMASDFNRAAARAAAAPASLSCVTEEMPAATRDAAPPVDEQLDTAVTAGG
jgi:hypothetical protein